MNEAPGALSRVCAGCGARYPGDALFCPLDGMPLQSAASAQSSQRELPDDPYLGQEISGHIEIRQLVGIGAMGRVYRAFQRGIDRDVAVKILHRELSSNAQLVSRFTREAKVASRLQHPNVVQVLLAGQLPDRALYMVMEYLEGLSLQSALAAAGGALPLPQSLHIAMQLCEATGEAHAVGIVHRDLKPENVMLVRRGTDPDFVKVLDFGIARINWGEQSVATAAGLIFGTARYISPEGAQGNAVGPASDVYAIATLLYQMLAGRTPFEGDQAVGLLVQQIHDAPPHLNSIPRAEYVPGPLADVIMANLAKDPGRREQEARALGHALVDAAKQSGLSPDDISRPMLRRQPGAMQMAPTERTKQHDLSHELSVRVDAGPARPANGSHVAVRGERPPTAETAKWEPPSEFQARLAEAVGAPDRQPSGVDDTLDDASGEASAVAPQKGPQKVPQKVPRTLPGDAESKTRGTDYAAPWMPPSSPRDPEAELADSEVLSKPHKSRGIVFVVLCFLLGMAIAAGWAWRMGKLGGTGGDEERYVARATDAMFNKRFLTPPGDNVRDITDEGLKKWPDDRRLLDVRVRAATELVSQATAQRSAGDIVEALRLARAAHELDPVDTSANRLVAQYDGELAAFTAPAAPPLGNAPAAAPLANASASPSLPGAVGKTPALHHSGVPLAAPAPGPQAPYKVILEASVGQPRLGQTVEFTARVAPPKGSFENAAFSIAGPGLGGGVNMTAQSPSPGVFQASYAFLEGGRFDVTFTTQVDGKSLKAGRGLVAGDPAPRAPDPGPKPAGPAPTSSVKWM